MAGPRLWPARGNGQPVHGAWLRFQNTAVFRNGRQPEPRQPRRPKRPLRILPGSPRLFGRRNGKSRSHRETGWQNQSARGPRHGGKAGREAQGIFRSEDYLEPPGFLGGEMEKAEATAKQVGRISPPEGLAMEAKLAERRKEY